MLLMFLCNYTVGCKVKQFSLHTAFLAGFCYALLAHGAADGCLLGKKITSL
jgi:hypothetical protein